MARAKFSANFGSHKELQDIIIRPDDCPEDRATVNRARRICEVPVAALRSRGLPAALASMWRRRTWSSKELIEGKYDHVLRSPSS